MNPEAGRVLRNPPCRVKMMVSLVRVTAVVIAGMLTAMSPAAPFEIEERAAALAA